MRNLSGTVVREEDEVEAHEMYGVLKYGKEIIDPRAASLGRKLGKRETLGLLSFSFSACQVGR